MDFILVTALVFLLPAGGRPDTDKKVAWLVQGTRAMSGGDSSKGQASSGPVAMPSLDSTKGPGSHESLNQGSRIEINAVFPPMVLTDRYYLEFGYYVLPSSLVDSVSPHLSWDMIDKGPSAEGGQYQWSTFDSQIQRFISAGKTVNIIVWPIGYSGKTTTPQYILTQVDHVSCRNHVDYPVPYEEAFKSNYKSFIAEVVRHYADNPAIGYIRFGLSSGGEIFPSCIAEMSGLNAPNTFSISLWLSYDKEMLDYEKSLNPTMKIMAPITAVDSDYIYPTAEAANAVANGFGFGSQGLQSIDISNYAEGRPCKTNWCANFDKYAGQVPLELQTLHLSEPEGGSNGTGPLPPLLSFGASRHATIFEVYTKDLLLALDPDYPGYSSYHQAYAAAISEIKRTSPGK